ncbi:MAG TPA: hypothetical protein VFN35_31350 [Ktedonobacteraceae bacterium]|nr:hypothetical protein [Ktedonobacteraceae bacterium]
MSLIQNTFGEIRIYDGITGEVFAQLSFPLAEQGHLPGTSFSVAWSSDGQRIAASFKNGLVCIWPTQ